MKTIIKKLPDEKLADYAAKLDGWIKGKKKWYRVGESKAYQPRPDYFGDERKLWDWVREFILGSSLSFKLVITGAMVQCEVEDQCVMVGHDGTDASIKWATARAILEAGCREMKDEGDE